MKSKLTVIYTATCECNEELTEIFAQFGEYECPKCKCKATVEEVPIFGVVGGTQQVRYAIGPNSRYTYGPFNTVDRCLALTPSDFIFSVDENEDIITILYKAVENQWIKC